MSACGKLPRSSCGKRENGVQVGLSVRKCGAMWLHCVSQMWPQNCMALRHRCDKLRAVSSVQVANAVGCREAPQITGDVRSSKSTDHAGL